MRQRKVSWFRLAVLISYFMLQCPFSCWAQTPSTGAEEITAFLVNSKDPAWEKRADAFYHLLGYEGYAKWDGRTYLMHSKLTDLSRAHPDRADEISVGLINLLSKENATVELSVTEFRATGKTLTEDYTNYYGDVIAAVSGLGDLRALSALSGAMATGGMATRALAELGPIALEPILSNLSNRDSSKRAAAIRALQTLAQPEYASKFSDDTSRQKIKAGLLRGAADSDWGVRATAARALASLPDGETIAVLQKLADSDPVTLPGQVADGGGPFYPVRHAAKTALEEIARSSLTPTANPK